MGFDFDSQYSGTCQQADHFSIAEVAMKIREESDLGKQVVCYRISGYGDC